MEIQSVRAEIERKLEPKLQRVLAEIRSGNDPEALFRDFLAEIHVEWSKYAEKIEERRRTDKQDFEEKLRILKKAFEAERLKNSKIWLEMKEHLLKIARMQRDHEQFGNLRGEALQEALGKLCSAVSNLLVSHEQVELGDEHRRMRAACGDVAAEQNLEMQRILDSRIRNNIPIPTICSASREIEAEIQGIMSVLHNLQSTLVSLSPDYWEPDDVANIRGWKLELEVKTGNLLEMLEDSEATHMRKLRDTLEFRPNRMRQIQH